MKIIKRFYSCDKLYNRFNTFILELKLSELLYRLKNIYLSKKDFNDNTIFFLGSENIFNVSLKEIIFEQLKKEGIIKYENSTN